MNRPCLGRSAGKGDDRKGGDTLPAPVPLPVVRSDQTAGNRAKEPETLVLAAPHAMITRCIDLVGAILLLVFLLPVMVLITIAIRIFNPGPALYRQKRIGRGGSEFECFKFRSMRCDSAEVLKILLDTDPLAAAEWALHQKLVNDPRVTPLGAFLRATSLDELPQLLNVIRGEMSLVGPRPIVRDEVPRYGRFISHYHAVKPGLTGLWQVTGRSGTTYRRRVATDRYYACSRSVGMDLRILAATVPAVLLRKGAV